MNQDEYKPIPARELIPTAALWILFVACMFFVAFSPYFLKA